ncbi:hypothetical protein M9Y10_037702 [Tritrichomonas musculus]|uniref:Carrier protein n=1 Tax=Tritrichomonas musculus TaxID=1915356 RepID=A0ABR2GR78_9EUKA
MSQINKIPVTSDKVLLQSSFAGAMMSGMITDFVFKGIQGAPNSIKLDLLDISLASIQNGVSNIAYQAAVDTLSLISEDFKNIHEDPKNKSQTIVYLAGGSLGALYATGINYPIQCLREFRYHKKSDRREFNMSFKGAEKFFTDRVFGYIGFATSMGCFCNILPKPKSNFYKWSQMHFLIQMSHLNGILTAYPYQMIRYNVKFGPYLKNYLRSIGKKMILTDLSSHFKKEITNIQLLSA